MKKSEGYNIKIADYVDAEKLEATYSLPPGSIETVDYVTGGGSLAAETHDNMKFDYVIASHMIEHPPDMIGFLKDCSNIMTPGGRLVMAVPDKRHCFDVFRGLTGAGEILQAHRDKRDRHTAGKLFDHAANAASRQGHIVWPLGFAGGLVHVHTLAEAKAAFDSYTDDGPYKDCHAWFFTPSSFRLIINDLRACLRFSAGRPHLSRVQTRIPPVGAEWRADVDGPASDASRGAPEGHGVAGGLGRGGPLPEASGSARLS